MASRSQTYITFRFPDKPIRKYRQTRGRLSGMGICQFIASIFDVNETLPKSKKFTDATITAMIVREFEGRNVVKNLIAGKVTIGYWRTLHNSGLLIGRVGRRDVPALPSRRYNEDGVRVNPRTGRIPTVKELAWLNEKERKAQERARALVESEREPLADEAEPLSNPQAG